MPKPKDATPKPPTTTETRIRTALSELLQIDETDITPSSKIQEDLGADSLDVVEFIMILEDTFDISIPDEKAEKTITVADAVKLVDKLVLAPKDAAKETVWG